MILQRKNGHKFPQVFFERESNSQEYLEIYGKNMKGYSKHGYIL